MADKDVLGKADGLMRRHSLPLPGGGDTGGVPVLTELVEPPGGATAQLARSIVERVMKEVEGRLAAELERRLAQQLAAQAHAAVASAIGEMRQELASAVAEAVRQELERRQIK